ncbi:Nif3-like dinuclear metal center hexameric protein [Virgibacillus sp. JSM 102003]|uniref:Nif3-like dinuclear metal center hexameric protein n=1 Tax=Virgibacillus sp. JSM 102003 TaxID=1562108 RepID=UPI0035BFE084
METSTRNSDIFQIMEKWAPTNLAYDWDNVGLQVGSFNNQVTKIMVTLDVLESVVDEAIEKDVDLIIAHHPLLFKSVKQVNVDTSQGRIIQKLIQHNISVYASHTNLDIAVGGVNDMLCELLNINRTEVLQQTYQEELVKIAVFVPKTHLNEVRDAMSENGAGHIGDYSHCTFQTEGKGTFMPQEGTNPYIGSANHLAYVDEVKVESIIPQPKLARVIEAMINAHPYEEAAYDLMPLRNTGQTNGIGRIGTLDKGLTLRDFSEQVKHALKVPSLRVTGDLTKKVRKVAVLGGSGEKFIATAKEMGADVYITGDMTFHTAQDAWQMGLSVIDPGHHVEKVMKEGTKRYLENRLDNKNIEVILSNSNTEPFQFI